MLTLEFIEYKIALFIIIARHSQISRDFVGVSKDDENEDDDDEKGRMGRWRWADHLKTIPNYGRHLILTSTLLRASFVLGVRE